MFPGQHVIVFMDKYESIVVEVAPVGIPAKADVAQHLVDYP